MGQDSNHSYSAAKIWEKREFKNLSNEVQIGTRNIKVALRRLRQFARTGASEHLDITDTIAATAKTGGYLDLKMAPERKNTIKLLLFFDIGGSMDMHIKVSEELFSAAHTEFKHIEFFYFHNCVYESVWTDNKRRAHANIDVYQLLQKYSADYKVIFVGDATMGPYEINYPGGSVEHWNEEAGAIWLQRICSHFSSVVWLNPQTLDYWPYHTSIQIIRSLLQDKMFPLTIDGLSDAIQALLARSKH